MMSLFSKCLMKWREPKVKGMVTPKNVLNAFGLILLVSVPFGFIGGHGKYEVSSWLLGLGFLSAAPLALLTSSFRRGTQIRLTEDAIIRAAPRRNQRSPYEDIDIIYLFRDCFYSWNKDSLVINSNQKTFEGPKFTHCEIIMKRAGVESVFSSLRLVHKFAVPENVDLEQVLRILRNKKVNVAEKTLDS
jgi:hypothetical protein